MMCRAGGRRCPSQSNHALKSAYNARRREIYHAKKNGLPIPPLKKDTIAEEAGIEVPYSQKGGYHKNSENNAPKESEQANTPLATDDSTKNNLKNKNIGNIGNNGSDSENEILEVLTQNVEQLNQDYETLDKWIDSKENSIEEINNKETPLTSNEQKLANEYNEKVEERDQKWSDLKKAKKALEKERSQQILDALQENETNVKEENSKPNKARTFNYGDTVERGGNANIFKRFPDDTKNLKLGEKILKPTKEQERLGIAVSSNTGELVQKGYFDNRQLHGSIKPELLNENSYKAFGFEDPNELPTKSKTLPRQHQKDYNLASQKETKSLTNSESSSIYDYTCDAYQGINMALTDESFVEKYGKSYQKKTESRIMNLDSALEKTPGVQRTVYRGVKGNSKFFGGMGAEKWLDDNGKVGSEIVFQNYQSTTMLQSITSSFGFGVSNEKGVVFEMKTPQGLNITADSEFENEHEVLMPRNARYMIVGKHFDKHDNKHVVQLVAINSKGEILDGTNHDKVEPVKF